VVAFGQIDPLIAPHMAFIERGYAEGLLLTSGAKVLRTGGIIIACGKSAADIMALVGDDPFHQAGLADYKITEFNPGNVAAAPK